MTVAGFWRSELPAKLPQAKPHALKRHVRSGRARALLAAPAEPSGNSYRAGALNHVLAWRQRVSCHGMGIARPTASPGHDESRSSRAIRSFHELGSTHVSEDGGGGWRHCGGAIGNATRCTWPRRTRASGGRPENAPYGDDSPGRHGVSNPWTYGRTSVADRPRRASH